MKCVFSNLKKEKYKWYKVDHGELTFDDISELPFRYEPYSVFVCVNTPDEHNTIFYQNYFFDGFGQGWQESDVSKSFVDWYFHEDTQNDIVEPFKGQSFYEPCEEDDIGIDYIMVFIKRIRDSWMTPFGDIPVLDLL